MTCAEGICITSLNYTVARDKIKAYKRCCENMVYATETATSDEMATSDLCLACGESAVKKDRRVLGGSGNTSEQVTAKTSRSNIPATTYNCSGLIVLTPSSLNALARCYSLKLGHG